MKKLFIVKHVQGAQIPRLIEAESVRKVENVILGDFEIVAVKSTNAGDLAKHVADGIKVEKSAE